MKRVFGILAALFVLIGCGGGGGGGGTSDGTLIGRVFNVSTGGPANPAATIQVGTRTTQTSLSDGSFQFDVPDGSSAFTVDGGTPPLWTFPISPAVSGNTDVGDVWIGPERVTLTGTIVNGTNSAPIAGAVVKFAGKIGTTNASGVFSLTDVAYSSATQTAFWGIIGTATATGFFLQEFSAQPFLASGGVVDVGQVLLTPTSDPNPPGTPFNVWGIVSAPGGASGSVVRLKQGGLDVRLVNVGADGRYVFFVPPGTYTISASKGASTAPDIVITLTQPNELIRRDVTIP